MRSEDEPLVDTVETDSRTVLQNEETVVIAYVGDATAWDVYANVDVSWVTTAVTMKIYGRTGGQRVLLQSFPLSSVGAVGVPLAAVVCSIRGTPVTAIEVTVLKTTSGPLNGGKFTLKSWIGNEPRLIATSPNLKALSSLPVRIEGSTRPGRTYGATTDRTSTGTNTAATVLGVLWATSSHAFDAEILRVTISYARGAGTSFSHDLAFKIAYFSTLSTPGTVMTAAAWDGSDDTESNISTLYTGSTISSLKPDLFSVVVDPSTQGTIVWEPGTASGQPLILPKGKARGLAVRSTLTGGGELEAAVRVIVSVQWIERP